MKGKPWTVEEERKLAQLVKERKPLNVIAETLKKNKDAVSQKCRRLGLKLVVVEVGYTQTPPTTTTSSLKVPAELPSIEESFEDSEGVSVEVIAKKLGMHYPAVAMKIHRLGLIVAETQC